MFSEPQSLAGFFPLHIEDFMLLAQLLKVQYSQSHFFFAPPSSSHISSLL